MHGSYHQVVVASEFGGAAEIAVRLAKHLQSDKEEDVTVWIPGLPGRAWQKATEMGLPVASYPAQTLLSGSRWAAGWSNLRFGMKLRSHRPGIVHVHDPIRYATMRPALKLSGLKTIVHVHLEYDDQGLQWAFRHPPDLIITCASFLEKQVRRNLPAEYRQQQRIAVVRNSVDVQRFHPGDKVTARQSVGAPADRPLVLMLANLAPHKGQETAIRAMAELRTRNVRAALWMAGIERDTKGSFRARLQQMIVDAGLEEDVRLLGYRDDAPTLLQATNILLLPSTNEGLPLTILEAQASQVPVIAAPTAGVPEVIADGVTGFLVDADDVQGYANRLEQLIRDPGRHQPMIQAAYEQAVSAHNWERYLEQMCDLYRTLLPLGSTEHNES